MDINDLFSWADDVAASMPNSASRLAETMSDPENIRFAVNVTVKLALELMPEHTELLKIAIEKAVEYGLDKYLEEREAGIDAALAKDENRGALIGGPELEALILQDGIKADAQLAAAVIEKATDEVNKEISADSDRSAQEVAQLLPEFDQELQKLESKLDRNEERYFEKNPDLGQDQRGAAEERFKEIRDQEVGALKDQQAERLAELQARQEADREELEKRLRELEDTRAER
jgi:hypothetical protein